MKATEKEFVASIQKKQQERAEIVEKIKHAQGVVAQIDADILVLQGALKHERGEFTVPEEKKSEVPAAVASEGQEEAAPDAKERPGLKAVE